MDKISRVKVFKELFELINIYYEERDLPSKDKFFDELESCCNKLEMDYKELKDTFGIKRWNEIWKNSGQDSEQ